MKQNIFKLLVCFSLISILGGCAARKAPVSLTGAGVAAWQANEVVIALDAVMNTAIALNEIVQCNPDCHQVLSEQNTRIVVQAVRGADITIKAYPNGWPVVAVTAIDQIETYLDTNGRNKIQPYLEAAKMVIKTLGVK